MPLYERGYVWKIVFCGSVKTNEFLFSFDIHSIGVAVGPLK